MATNPVEPDLALHHGFLEPSREPSPDPVEPDLALRQTLPDLLRNLLRNLVEPNLAQHQSLPKPSPEPSPEPCWTWPGSAPKPPWPFREPFLEPSPKPCWTWCGSAPKPPGIFSGTFSGALSNLNLTWPGSAPKPRKRSPASRTLLNLTWLCTKASRNILRNLLGNPVEPDQNFPDLHWNLLRNPVEPDLALHQPSPKFFGTLFNLTWLCTTDLHWNLLQNPVEPDLALHQPSPKFFGTLLNLTSLCTKGSRPSPEPFWNLLWNPVEPDLALHQGFLEPSPEPSLEPCWTWPGSAPKPPGFFSGTFRNLRNLLRNLVEPDPAAAPVHTGAILCWLAYAVGEKSCIHPVDSYFILFETVRVHKEKCQERIVH